VHASGAESALAALSDFVDSVRWTEPFVAGLIALHCALLVVALSLRKSQVAQVTMLLAISAIVFSARSLNSLGHSNWQLFATQDYFDSQGMFMAIFVSGPLLLTANVAVVSQASVCWSSSFLRDWRSTSCDASTH
jgi:hypothetical protein